MTASSDAYQLFVGVDIAATTFAASWTTATLPRQRALTFAQTPDGFTAFQERLRALGVPPGATLIVIEATGSYWVALAVSLHEAGFAVAVV
jgi:transposase